MPAIEKLHELVEMKCGICVDAEIMFTEAVRTKANEPCNVAYIKWSNYGRKTEVAVGMFNWRLLEALLMGSSGNKRAKEEAVFLILGHIKILVCIPSLSIENPDHTMFKDFSLDFASRLTTI